MPSNSYLLIQIDSFRTSTVATEAVILYSEYQSPLAQPVRRSDVLPLLVSHILTSPIECSATSCSETLSVQSWGCAYKNCSYYTLATGRSETSTGQSLGLRLLLLYLRVSYSCNSSKSRGFLKLLHHPIHYCWRFEGSTVILPVVLPLFSQSLYLQSQEWGGKLFLCSSRFFTAKLISRLGNRFFIVQIVVNSLIVLGWALVINNIFGRRYPTNWWWPSPQIVI